MRKTIDSLLEVDEGNGISALTHYREYPKYPTAELILDYLDRYENLKEMGTVDLDFSSIKMEVVLQFYNTV